MVVEWHCWLGIGVPLAFSIVPIEDRLCLVSTVSIGTHRFDFRRSFSSLAGLSLSLRGRYSYPFGHLQASDRLRRSLPSLAGLSRMFVPLLACPCPSYTLPTSLQPPFHLLYPRRCCAQVSWPAFAFIQGVRWLGSTYFLMRHPGRYPIHPLELGVCS